MHANAFGQSQSTTSQSTTNNEQCQVKRARRKSYRSEVLLQLQLLQLLSLRRRHPECPCRRRPRPRPDTSHPLHLRQAAQPLCTRTLVIDCFDALASRS